MKRRKGLLKRKCTGGVLLKTVSLKVSQNSNTCNRVSFAIKLQATDTGFFAVNVVKF